MAFVSCAKLTAELALKQGVLKDCNGADLPAGTEMATCADLAGLSIADATETIKGKVELATTAEASAGTSTTTVVTPAGLKAALDAAAPNLKTCSGADMAFDAQVPTCTEMNAAIAASVVTVPDATDTTKGKVALNAGTSLPADATNCTDALTACGLNALLADATVGGNAVINGIKALIPASATVPDATETVKGISELATTAEATAGTSTTTVVTPAGVKAALDAAAPNLKTCSGADMAFDAQVPTCTEMNAAIAAAAPNGSETKVTAGTNVTVTGTGTTASPYVVNATGGGGTERAVASTAQAQAWTDNTVDLTPLRLHEAFKGANQQLTTGLTGYQRLPGGVILQWGGAFFSNGGTFNTFPIAFTTICRSLTFGIAGNTTTLVRVDGAGPQLTGFNAITNGTDGYHFYIAIGY